MTNEQQQQSNILENAEEGPIKGSYSVEDEIITNEAIDKTPFRVVGSKKQGFSITMGKYRLTEPKKTWIECVDTLNTEQWIVIANMIALMFVEMRKEEEEEKKTTS